jgi:CDP-6-deoxy-D-xylo-4-hexulose-3-dehydrase
VPPLGWVSDVAPLVNLGMTPVFVDIDMSNLAITAERIEQAINEKTKAIVLVHALGFNAMSEKILELAKKHNLFLIEDCCESHGATHKGKRVGTFGDVSNFSFYFGHHITTVEGGMICTDNDELYDYIKMFRSHGMTREASQETKEKYAKQYPDLNPLFTFAVPGYNMRSCEINAVIGLEQMKRLDYNISKRVENLNTWLQSLSSDKYWTDFDSSGNSNFSLPLVLKKADKHLLNKVCSLLEREGVEYRLGTAGGGNQAKQPYLQKDKNSFKVVGNLENINHVHNYALYVGNHTELNEKQIINLCNKLNET